MIDANWIRQNRGTPNAKLIAHMLQANLEGSGVFRHVLRTTGEMMSLSALLEELGFEVKSCGGIATNELEITLPRYVLQCLSTAEGVSEWISCAVGDSLDELRSAHDGLGSAHDGSTCRIRLGDTTIAACIEGVGWCTPDRSTNAGDHDE